MSRASDIYQERSPSLFRQGPLSPKRSSKSHCIASSIDQVLASIQFVQLKGRTVDERRQMSYLVEFVIDQDAFWQIKDM
jgi:hypothetical protein